MNVDPCSLKPLSRTAGSSLPARSHYRAAFTLIEVVFALVILGGSLVVLLGLQSSLIDRTLRDETNERALLLTRELLAPLEAGISEPEETNVTGSFEEVYSKVLGNSAKMPSLTEQDQQYRVSYTISKWPVPGLDDADVMRKVTVSISWGDGTGERAITNYFFPAP